MIRCQRLLADPAQREARKRDTKLRRRKVCIQMPADMLNKVGALAALFQKRVELSRSAPSQRKIRMRQKKRSAPQARQSLPVFRQSTSADPNAAERFRRARLLPIKSTGLFISRMRILASETGSLVVYQLDLVTPGINPCEASSRKVRRDILNRRMNARRRPVTSQRFTTRVGLASRGSCARPA